MANDDAPYIGTKVAHEGRIMGTCLGCGAIHEGKIEVSLVVIDGTCCLSIGAEVEGDTIHSITVIPVSDLFAMRMA